MKVLTNNQYSKLLNNIQRGKLGFLINKQICYIIILNALQNILILKSLTYLQLQLTKMISDKNQNTQHNQQQSKMNTIIELHEDQYMDKNILEQLSRVQHSTIHISGMQWRYLNINRQAKKIKRWNVPDRLNISNNKQPDILYSIQHIEFPYLKILTLDYNSIVSIENLSQIQMPLLQQLSLNDNYISNTNSLRRCDYHFLSKILISGNRIVEFKGLSQLKAANLRQLAIQKDNTSKVQGYDIRWFIKLEPFGFFESLWFKSVNRIKQKQFSTQIKNKYPYLI